METGLKIAEVARRSGFAATTLRYYEEIGLVTPTERTPAGYRLYDETAVDRLAFIARAKQLGCSLDEIAELVTAWAGGSCAPVQDHLRALLETKIDQSQTQAAELIALTSQLQRARRGLDHNTPDGPCDETCGCTTDSAETAAVILTARPSNPAPIACTLDGSEMPDRIAEWQALLSTVLTRSAVPGGVRLTFSDDVPLAEVARLAAAEQDCCRFFSFALTLDERGTALEVRAPEDALPLVEALFGAAA
jgi:DNA-binding transcriptional MerR regulator